MVLDVGLGALYAALVPDRLRARVSGAFLLVNYGVRPIGALGGGLLAAAVGLQPTMWVTAIGALAGVLWLLPSPMPRLRDLPRGGGRLLIAAVPQPYIRCRHGRVPLRGPPDQLRRLRRGRAADRARPRPADEPPHVRPARARSWPSAATGWSPSTCSATAAPTGRRTCGSTRCRSSPARWWRCSTTSRRTRRWSAAPRWAPTSPSSWRSAIRSGPAALFIEMPVLDNALSVVAGLFTPVLLGLQIRPPASSRASRSPPR